MRYIKYNLLPIKTNCKKYIDTVEEEVSSHLGDYVVEIV